MFHFDRPPISDGAKLSKVPPRAREIEQEDRKTGRRAREGRGDDEAPFRRSRACLLTEQNPSPLPPISLPSCLPVQFSFSLLLGRRVDSRRSHHAYAQRN